MSYQPFALPLRVLHWAMALLIGAQLVIGLLAATHCISAYSMLLAIHRPLGALLLLLVIIRLIIRFATPTPTLPSDLSPALKAAAYASQVALYGLMIVTPLCGWAMLSAGHYEISLFDGFHLPAILSVNSTVWHELRSAHNWLAFSLFALVALHITAAMFHKLIRKDHVLDEMTL